MKLSLSAFDYQLPRELIAQEPAKPRDQARLLCLNRADGSIDHRRFYQLSEILRPDDLLVVNDSKVFPARLFGHKETGGQVEIFLHRQINSHRWECLLGGRVHPDLTIFLTGGLQAHLLKDQGDGTWLVDFNWDGQKFWRALEKIGRMPLPPYITVDAGQSLARKRYQTVYAEDKHTGSVAAPTAGLHFTNRLLAKLRKQGIKIVPVTLHVGLGTFATIKTEDIVKHQMHSEFVSISKRSAQIIAAAKLSGRRIVAVGTTSCRTLEAYGQAVKEGRIVLGEAYQEWTQIFIYPGYKFQLVDALITNFHLPKSSLLLLVSALAGVEPIKAAYQEAIRQKYLFYSYGDAMFIG